MIAHEDIDDGPLTSKLHKKCCCTSCCCACNFVFRPCRKAVSGNKRRIRKGNFDLDMAYVAPRIIVHGFPATGLEHMYRNPRGEIKRYLDEFHKDNYKLYNFCCEYGRGYDPSVFHGRVERYPFKDHNIPPLITMATFANSVKSWLDDDPSHVVSMHCKAGKGRAGLMSCIALIRTGVAQSAKEALEIYDRERVVNNKGLTVTSQRKMVIFYELLWRKHWNEKGNIGAIQASNELYQMPVQPKLHLFGVEVLNLPPELADYIRVKVSDVTNFGRKLLFDTKPIKTNYVSIACNCYIEANFCIAIQFKKGFFGQYITLMELLHNTYFMDSSSAVVDFGPEQLDMKRKVKAKLGDTVKLRLKFGRDTSGQISTASTERIDPDVIEVELGNPVSASVNNYLRVPDKDDHGRPHLAL